MSRPITQSDLWKQLQDDLEETSFDESEEGYYYLAILKKTPVGN